MRGTVNSKFFSWIIYCSFVIRPSHSSHIFQQRSIFEMYAAHKLLARRFATNRAALSTPEMNLKKVLKRMGQTKLPPPGIKQKQHISIYAVTY